MPKLQPTVVTQNEIGDVAFDGVRRRPVMAVNDEGETVICCRRTAKKHGWEVKEKLFHRVRAHTSASEDFAPKVKKQKAAHDSSIDELLG